MIGNSLLTWIRFWFDIVEYSLKFVGLIRVRFGSHLIWNWLLCLFFDLDIIFGFRYSFSFSIGIVCSSTVLMGYFIYLVMCLNLEFFFPFILRFCAALNSLEMVLFYMLQFWIRSITWLRFFFGKFLIHHRKFKINLKDNSFLLVIGCSLYKFLFYCSWKFVHYDNIFFSLYVISFAIEINYQKIHDKGTKICSKIGWCLIDCYNLFMSPPDFLSEALMYDSSF